MSTRTRCAKRVYSGERWDRGHQCSRYAPGSEFCRIHGPQDDREVPTNEVQTPTVSSHQQTNYYARLNWAPGEGPVVKIPYRQGNNPYGFITGAAAHAADNAEPTIAVTGVVRKQDGTPGQQTWESTWRGETLLPKLWLTELLATLDDERTRFGSKS